MHPISVRWVIFAKIGIPQKSSTSAHCVLSWLHDLTKLSCQHDAEVMSVGSLA